MRAVSPCGLGRVHRPSRSCWGAPMNDRPSRRRRSATSAAAFDAAKPRAPSARLRIYRYVADHPGTTREAIALGLGICLSTVTPRVRELIDAGHLREIDDAGRTVAGRAAARLMATALPYPPPPPAEKPAEVKPPPRKDQTGKQFLLPGLE